MVFGTRAVTGGMSEGWVRRWCATRGKKVSGQLRNCDRSTKDYVMVVTALQGMAIKKWYAA